MSSALTYAALAAAFVSLAWCYTLSRRFNSATRPRSGQSEPPLAMKVADRTEALDVRVADLEGQVGQLVGRVEEQGGSLSSAIRHLSMVRYDALPGAAGEQSFSIAMLDDRRSGFVLTGIYGRSEYRFYAKPMSEGASQYPLSEEEESAIAQAMRDRVPAGRGAQ